jgi:oxaloacetate decarboxylase alpha subunit
MSLDQTAYTEFFAEMTPHPSNILTTLPSGLNPFRTLRGFQGDSFTRLAEAEGLPAGCPQAFDASYLQHQLPGETIGTMRRHLAESRVPHLEGAVIEELDRVRQELGWPIVMTPFAQILITQAVLNVTGKQRRNSTIRELCKRALNA